jgi:hypothetical protein
VLDHVALEVADLARAARFYDAVMRPLGGRRIVDSPDGIGYGHDRAELWIMPRRPEREARANGAPAAATSPSPPTAGGPSTPPTARDSARAAATAARPRPARPARRSDTPDSSSIRTAPGSSS